MRFSATCEIIVVSLSLNCRSGYDDVKLDGNGGINLDDPTLITS